MTRKNIVCDFEKVGVCPRLKRRTPSLIKRARFVWCLRGGPRRCVVFVGFGIWVRVQLRGGVSAIGGLRFQQRLAIDRDHLQQSGGGRDGVGRGWDKQRGEAQSPEERTRTNMMRMRRMETNNRKFRE
eukprot:2338122-Pleurochrysis_carterae.AAC.2